MNWDGTQKCPHQAQHAWGQKPIKSQSLTEYPQGVLITPNGNKSQKDKSVSWDLVVFFCVDQVYCVKQENKYFFKKHMSDTKCLGNCRNAEGFLSKRNPKNAPKNSGLHMALVKENL